MPALRNFGAPVWIGFVGRVAAVVVLGCAPVNDTAVEEVADIFGPMGEIVPFATAEQRERFERGRDFLTRRFAPSEGLGPRYSATSCGACHEKPVFGGSASRYRNVFVLVTDEPGITVDFKEQFTTDDQARAPDEPETLTVGRRPLPLFGVGLLAEIPLEEIVHNADPMDHDQDGISGRVNFERGFLGRFGRKAHIATVEGFVRLALLDHLGLTTDPVVVADLAPEDAPRGLSTGDDDMIPDPELASEDVADVITFVSLLAAPHPMPSSPQTKRGRERFEQCGCDDCHIPALIGPRGAVPAFTDLLLHDMGPELADGVQIGEASGSEFRTQPLWGLSIGGPYLHDGRADTIADAIRLHGGEARSARERYLASTDADQQAMLVFLESLGENFHRRDGLLPIDDPPPSAGASGGPQEPLSSLDLMRFERGRRLFDSDFGFTAGLGPRFNGDSCRSCHFDSVIGGSGPADVDVIRHGTITMQGIFEIPPMGTIAHRHWTMLSRPPITDGANRFERRQTPTTLGSGMIDQIASEAILGLADPEDEDADGIRGRAHVLSDGRVGRFGWKANIPTLEEFVRDALSNELGITVPSTGSAFGRATDEDHHLDPEIRAPELDDLVFFMSKLAPPRRASNDPVAEARGEALFSSIGCGRCHVAELPTLDGATVQLFSDLLLHDVAAENAVFVPEGDAIREFRTAPLWGIGTSAPYLHDGSAETLMDAILRHDTEATSVREEFERLTRSQQDDLLSFLVSL